VVADQELGSAIWLVEPGESGVLYSEQNLDAKLDQLADIGRQGILAMGRSGNLAMHDMWSSEVAAKRTIALSKSLIDADIETAKRLFVEGVAKFIG
jgi:hypothetical protein